MAWVQQGHQYDDWGKIITPGGWKNTAAADDYDPAGYMSDAAYQKMIAEQTASTEGINKYMTPHSGIGYNPVMGNQDPLDMSGWGSGGQLKTPTAGMMQGGAQAA